MGIPEQTIKQGVALAEGATVYGVEFTDMSRDELIAIAAIGWDAYTREMDKEQEFVEARR